MIDLRSDTVTKPTDAMRKAMAEAEVGDDVFGEDPTVNRLQERSADLFEKEAALFVPTGSMGNEIAVKVHTRPGQEIITEERGHVLNFELGAAAVISGVTIRAVRSGDGSGHLTWEEIAAVLKVGQPYYVTGTGLVCLENTHNFAGGSVMTAKHCREVCTRSHDAGIPVHLDGARIFNAAAALGESVAELSRHCDSVMFTLSKGLGAPAGSVLLGSRAFIDEARVWRKRLGGGMRQIGILAAAGLLALDDGPAHLETDHANARRMAEGLAAMEGIDTDLSRVVTNIVLFDVAASGFNAEQVCSRLREQNVLAIGFGTQIRMVTHRDVSANGIDTALQAMRTVLQ